MPFLGIEKWEEHIFESYDVEVDIPCDDVYAYKLNPSHRHLYYKPLVLDLLGVYNAPSGSPVNSYPVIQKPVINPFGMGMGVEAFESDYDEDRDYKPGTFIMEKYEGQHTSVDCLVVDGNLEFTQTAIGIPGPGQTFEYWELIKRENSLPQKIKNFIETTNYTGAMNIEMIGRNLIEIALRFSGQFVDMYHEFFLTNIISLYKGTGITHPIEQVSGRYSVPIFVPDVYDERLAQFCSSDLITYTLEADITLPGGQRFGYINTDDLECALALRKEIHNAIDDH